MSQDSKRVSEAQVRRELMRMDQSAARRRMATGVVVIVALALLAGTLAAKFLFIAADVRTDGMSPGLNSGDVVFCLRTNAPFLQVEPRRGALALVRYSESGMRRHTLRRLIALGGDEVSVDREVPTKPPSTRPSPAARWKTPSPRRTRRIRTRRGPPRRQPESTT